MVSRLKKFTSPQFIFIDVEIFNIVVAVGLNVTEDAFLAEMIEAYDMSEADTKRLIHNLEGWNNGYGNGSKGRMINYGEYYFVLINAGDGGLVDFINSVSHEMTHVTQFLLNRNRDTPLKKSTEELYAYLQAYLLCAVLKKVMK